MHTVTAKVVMAFIGDATLTFQVEEDDEHQVYLRAAQALDNLVHIRQIDKWYILLFETNALVTRTYNNKNAD